MSGIKFSDTSIQTFSGLGSRLIAGNSRQALYCEDFLAEFFKAQSALFFNSGFDANLGFFSTVPQKDEVVLYDRAIHASIRDGLRLSMASSYSFEHNNLVDLEQKLLRFREKNCLIVVEGVYSMDGDQAPLEEIIQLASRYGSYVVVDEAHSMGVVGGQGLGLSFQFADHPNILARIVTFGKAVGAHGAAVLASKNIKDFLIHACRTFIYTTALPPESYTRVQNCLEFLHRNPEKRKALFEVTKFFSEKFDAPNQYIQAIPIRGIENVKRIMLHAAQKKIAIKGVWSPTVDAGQERLRISLHAYNEKSEIENLLDFINELNYG